MVVMQTNVHHLVFLLESYDEVKALELILAPCSQSKTFTSELAKNSRKIRVPKNEQTIDYPSRRPDAFSKDKCMMCCRCRRHGRQRLC
jgi:hypothetical protein